MFKTDSEIYQFIVDDLNRLEDNWVMITLEVELDVMPDEDVDLTSIGFTGEYIDKLGDKIANIPAIITDIEMPEMSGFTVIQTLKANPIVKHIPIIVNSSMTGNNNKREAEVLGAEGFVDKTKSHDIIPLIVSIMNK